MFTETVLAIVIVEICCFHSFNFCKQLVGSLDALGVALSINMLLVPSLSNLKTVGWQMDAMCVLSRSCNVQTNVIKGVYVVYMHVPSTFVNCTDVM